MDYKYIEQLTERYFQCETTLQEEQILKAFFAQDEQDVPEQLRQYQPLFTALQPAETLGDDFDERILSQIEGPKVVKARTISISERLRPLFKAAAVVAIVLTLGNAMNLSLRQNEPQSDDINYSAYKDTYDDPAVAYDKMEDALQLISEGFSQLQHADSLRMDSLYSQVK
jgi:hypothetical protein